MKRVVFSLSLFILLAFSSAHLFNHHSHRIKLSSDGADSSTNIDYETRFNRNGHRFNPHRSRCHHHHHRFIRDPPQFVGVNELGAAPVREYRTDVDLRQISTKDDKEAVFPAEARVLHHRHVARNFPEVEGDDQKMLDRFNGHHYMIPHYHHRFHHHHHHHRYYQKAAAEVGVKHGDHDHENRGEHLLKKIGKFLGYF
ncbi:hypothetical protein SOVF_066610 [Spinacia oleracea]|nr:hypothetical protein SOVF_066610 [Spinacia oleracea]